MHLEVSQFIEDRWVCSLLELSGVIHGVTAEYEPSLWVFFFSITSLSRDFGEVLVCRLIR